MFFLSDLPLSFNHSVSHGIRLGYHRWLTLPVAYRLSHWAELCGVRRRYLVDSGVSNRHWKNLSSSIRSMISMYFFFILPVCLADQVYIDTIITFRSHMAVDLKTARRTLPAPMVDRSSFSIFSVIKQAIGKDLTRFSIPVVWNGTSILELTFMLWNRSFLYFRTTEFPSTCCRDARLLVLARSSCARRAHSRALSFANRVRGLELGNTSRTYVQTIQSSSR